MFFYCYHHSRMGHRLGQPKPPMKKCPQKVRKTRKNRLFLAKSAAIWLRGPDLNRRPSGYEGVSAKIPWTDCRKQHEMDGISAHWSIFQPDLSNWCADVFPVVGQNVGQATMQKTQGVPAAYHHFIFACYTTHIP